MKLWFLKLLCYLQCWHLLGMQYFLINLEVTSHLQFANDQKVETSLLFKKSYFSVFGEEEGKKTG